MDIFSKIEKWTDADRRMIRRQTMKVSIYTDGAARGNPDGPGGYGVVLEYVDPKGELHGWFHHRYYRQEGLDDC